jgi:hypothetical protein
VSGRKLLTELKPQIVLQGRSRALSEALGNENGADFCVTWAGKNRQLLDHLG